MAVPSSGELLMRKLAKEKLYDDYNSAQGITGPISMYDLVNGGNTNGSGHSYDITNTGSLSYPDTVVPHRFEEWYSYDHDSATYIFPEPSNAIPDGPFNSVSQLLDPLL